LGLEVVRWRRRYLYRWAWGPVGHNDERSGHHYRPAYGCVLWAEELLLPELRLRGSWLLRGMRRGGLVIADKNTV
jgi:hypothetical protein